MAVQILIELFENGDNNSQWKLKPLDIYDLTNNLLETEEISIDKRVEFDGVFKTSVSNVDLSLVDMGEEAFNYLKRDNLSIYTIGIQIIKDGIPKYWGYIDRESIERNEIIGDVVSLTSIDWYKYLMEGFKDRILPSYVTAGFPMFNNISDFFYLLFPTEILAIVDLHIGTMSDIFNYDDLLALRNNFMYIPNFITELQKHYGALIFLAPNKHLKFINRGMFINENATDITNMILESANNSLDYKTTECKVSDYNSLLCNAKGDWSVFDGYSNYEGWAHIYYDINQGKITGEMANQDLSNISKRYTYLDIRQKLTSNGEYNFIESFDYKLFADRSGIDRFNDFKTVLFNTRTKHLFVNNTNIELFEKVTINNGPALQVFRSNEKLLSGYTELELTEIPLDE